MSDKLYYPKCGREEEFIIKKVTLEVEGLPREFSEPVSIICCCVCKLPICSYTDCYHVEENGNSKS